MGHLQRICQDVISPGRRSTRDMFIRDVRRSGRCILEDQIFSFGKMILRSRCSTSHDLASFFSWQAQYFRDVDRKIGTRPFALHSTFHFRRKSRRIALFLTFPPEGSGADTL